MGLSPLWQTAEERDITETSPSWRYYKFCYYNLDILLLSCKNIFVGWMVRNISQKPTQPRVKTHKSIYNLHIHEYFPSTALSKLYMVVQYIFSTLSLYATAASNILNCI